MAEGQPRRRPKEVPFGCILKYVEDLRRGRKADIGRKDFFEIAYSQFVILLAGPWSADDRSIIKLTQEDGYRQNPIEGSKRKTHNTLIFLP